LQVRGRVDLDFIPAVIQPTEELSIEQQQSLPQGTGADSL